MGIQRLMRDHVMTRAGEGGKIVTRILWVLTALLAWHSAGASAATLLVANKSADTVSLVQLPGGEVVATLPTGAAPHEVAVSPDGRVAVISDYGTRERAGDTLTVIEVPAARPMATIALPAGTRPHGLQWLDDRRILVTAEGIRSLLLVDVVAREVTETIAIEQEIAHMVAASAERAFTANIGSGTATAVDLAGAAKIGDLASGEGAEGIALADGGRELWVSNRGADTVSVFDARTLARLDEIELPGFPIRVETDDPRGRIYATLPKADALAVIDRQSRTVSRIIPFDIGPDRERKTLFGDMLPDSSIPIGVLLSRDGSALFVAHSNAHVISVYDAQSLERTAIIPAGLEPDGMDWSPLEVKRPGT
jgi:DNA-binding beta-propeller fold protein YncE